MSVSSGDGSKNLYLVGPSGFQIHFEVEKPSHLTPAVFESHADLGCNGRHPGPLAQNGQTKYFRPTD